MPKMTANGRTADATIGRLTAASTAQSCSLACRGRAPRLYAPLLDCIARKPRFVLDGRKSIEEVPLTPTASLAFGADEKGRGSVIVVSDAENHAASGNLSCANSTVASLASMAESLRRLRRG